MQKFPVIAFLALISFIPAANAQQAAAPAISPEPESNAAGRLPVKRVVLYKNGVGYFEHSARVHGTQDLKIDFTSAQLNDALKSLTVVDLGGGHINGVRFNSIAPLSERLKTLRLPLDEDASRSDLLEALRGTRVEVRSGTTSTTGKLLGIEATKRFGAKSDMAEEVTVLTLVTDAGEIRSFELWPGTSVRIADHELADEVNRYLNLIGSAKAVDLRRLTISDSGTGDREIFVSYISEVPVWKSTYRILLDAKYPGQPLVQGWAVVDNTIGEDWKDVQLSLVAGAPQSFVQNISQPMYVQRPVVPVPGMAILTPETHESALLHVPSPGLTMAPPPPPPPPAAAPARLMGGEFGGTLGGPVKLKAMPRYAAVAAEVEREGAQAESKSVGDFFEYDLKGKVTIGKNQSALVPILQARIEAEKVTLWNEDTGQPLRALWLNNTSGVEFDAGSFNILDDATFSGEGMVDAVRPGEKRLITYAADPAVQVKVNAESSARPFSRLVVARGILTLTREDRQAKTYTISNSDTTPRVVIIEHPASPVWKLVENVKPDESSASFYRFRVKVEAKSGAQLVVEEYRPQITEVVLTNLDSELITVLTEQKRMTPEIERAFNRVLDQKAVVAGFDKQIQSRRTEESSIANDQGRIRENMKALKGTPEEKALVQRYTQQLNDQEDRVAALRSQISDLQTKRQQASDQLDQILTEIALDEKF